MEEKFSKRIKNVMSPEFGRRNPTSTNPETDRGLGPELVGTQHDDTMIEISPQIEEFKDAAAAGSIARTSQSSFSSQAGVNLQVSKPISPKRTQSPIIRVQSESATRIQSPIRSQSPNLRPRDPIRNRSQSPYRPLSPTTRTQSPVTRPQVQQFLRGASLPSSVL